MCGIAGIVRFDRPGTASRSAVASMRAALAHRGPDGAGAVVTSFAALAQTRLAMLDPGAGAAPLQSSDGRYTLVYNGELFNDLELRSALPRAWQSRSDAETLLAAWTEWGEACLERLDGMFSFFIWDDVLQAGFAARDRLGVKPFAYLETPCFAFASEAKALLAVHGCRPRADVEAIVEYLVAAPFSGVARSPFAGVQYLPPGYVLRVDRGGLSTHPYFQWKPDLSEPLDAPNGARELRRELERAVASAARADAPLGVFLSGGLDSTSLAAIARSHGATLPAFTVTFEGQAAWDAADSRLVVSDDTPFARAAASELGLPLSDVRFDRSTLEGELHELAVVNDALPAWEQELSQRALARAASRSVKGVLVGDAADETHFGYHFLLDDVALTGPEAIFRRFGVVPVLKDVSSDPVAHLDTEYRALCEAAGRTFGSRSERVLAMTELIVRRWLPRLLHNGDVQCMAFGLEPRVPFCATALIRLASRVPPEVGLAGGVEKSLLREAVRGLVPEAIRIRKKSALPKDQDVGAIYQREARRVATAPHPVVRRIVDLDVLAPLFEKHVLDEVERAQLFRVIGLQHWAAAYDVAEP
jgi:asparagine synthase (glutamine-hydrolysing)